MTASAAIALPKVKPKLRGLFHLIAFCAAIPASGLLTWSPRSGEAYLGGLIYAATLTLMLGMSALYHVPTWSPSVRPMLRRLDHADIFFLVAGTFTALWTLSPAGLRWSLLPWVMWATAITAALTLVWWTNMNRSLRAASYVVLGLTGLPLLVRMPQLIGWPATLLVMAGAAVYLVGALVYSKRWPNPNPLVFGYHEVFHIMVVIAAALQFAAIVFLHWARR